MTTTAIDAESSLQSMLARAIAVAAAAGGLIHFKAALDHRQLIVIAVGFALMAVAQLLFAGAIVTRPSIAIMVSGGVLHLAIFLTWILSRTIGLPFIPGAESTAAVGVPDVIANTFSIAVVAAAISGISLPRSSDPVPLPVESSRR